MPMHTAHAVALKKRLTPLYIAAFLQGLIFWFAIEKLFMHSIGFNDKTIATAVIAFTAVTAVASIPIGVLADRWSRKGILVIASCTMALACVIGGLSHGFGMYLLAACFSGLFFACYQGIYDSVVYDVLMEETGSGSGFERYYGKVELYNGAALVIGGLASAVITHYLSLRSAYFLTTPFILASLVALWRFREPQEHKKEVNQLLGHHINATFKAIFRKDDVLWIVVTLVLASIVSKLLLDFDQLWFIALALPLALYGPFDAVLLTSFSSGGYISGKLKSDKVLMGFGLIALLSSLVLFMHHSFLVIVAQTVIVTLLVVYSIVFEGYLHDTMPSKVRVGAASIVATIGYATFLPVAYLFGAISSHHDIFHATWVIVIVLAALILSGSKVIAAKRR